MCAYTKYNKVICRQFFMIVLMKFINYNVCIANKYYDP